MQDINIHIHKHKYYRYKYIERKMEREKWLMERGYRERMFRTQILKARGESRDSLLEQGNTRTSESKLI